MVINNTELTIVISFKLKKYVARYLFHKSVRITVDNKEVMKTWSLWILIGTFRVSFRYLSSAFPLQGEPPLGSSCH